ncbi:phage tail domain-containing protein [Terribacillus sp. 179-K 1B1 HS]|uniref:phage tail domain-containing protein n=1 Tax=Terribacillus sp. 179-K 1B1 HS TaxID=3142388 RepID=UPI0039A10ADB
MNGESIKLSELGVEVRDFLVSSVTPEYDRATVTGRPGSIERGGRYASRTIDIPVYFKAVDILDYPFVRDKLFYWLGGIEPVWLYEGRRPYLNADYNEYLYGKRYLAKPSGAFSFDQQDIYGFSDSITFELHDLPFGQSTGTTLNPFVVGQTGDAKTDNIWALGHAEVFRDDLRYSFTGNGTFNVYNGGTEAVNPRYMPLVIKYAGASSNLTITNRTNGTRWKFNGDSTASQTIVIDGVRSMLGAQSIVRNTTGELLTLEPGDNEIVVSGASGGTLTFDFRFYFR